MNLLINVSENVLTLFTYKGFKFAFNIYAFNIYAYNCLDSGTKLL